MENTDNFNGGVSSGASAAVPWHQDFSKYLLQNFFKIALMINAKYQKETESQDTIKETVQVFRNIFLMLLSVSPFLDVADCQPTELLLADEIKRVQWFK